MVLTAHEVGLLAREELTQADIQYFRGKYGMRFVKALRAVEEGRIVKYLFKPSGLTAWVVRGVKREYLVIPENYCSCRSFYQSVVIAGEVDTCYHILAQKIAEVRGSYETIDSTDGERRKMHVVWRRTE
jgi:predicted nucleic acid-binding Zn finger protein